MRYILYSWWWSLQNMYKLKRIERPITDWIVIWTSLPIGGGASAISSRFNDIQQLIPSLPNLKSDQSYCSAGKY